MNRKLDAWELNNFYRAVLSLENESEAEMFFEDICTVAEVKSFAQRLDVAKLLKEGETYVDIAEKTGASTATISRVARSLYYGAGGYNIVLEREINGKS